MPEHYIIIGVVRLKVIITSLSSVKVALKDKRNVFAVKCGISRKRARGWTRIVPSRGIVDVLNDTVSDIVIVAELCRVH